MTNATVCMLMLILLVLVIFVLYSTVNKPKRNTLARTSNNSMTGSDYSLAVAGQQMRSFKTVHGVATKTWGLRPIRKATLTSGVPIQFDSRIKFGKMGIPNSGGLKGCISAPNDQGTCGSSWAFAVVAMLSDRIRIQSSVPAIEGMALRDQNLSAEWLMRFGNQCAQLTNLLKGNANFSCTPCADCQLGTPVLALQYVEKNGCAAENAQDLSNNDLRAIDLYKIKEFYTTSIDISSETNYYFFPGQRPMRADAEWAYHLGVENAQRDISARGPLVVVFNMYSDLLEQYCDGLKNDDVYIQPEGSRPILGHVTQHGVRYLGDQAACIVGWGEKYYYSEKIEYWVLRMTWGGRWNGDGYFKIQRGVNCCNLELEMLGSWGYVIESAARGSYVEQPAVDMVPILARPSSQPGVIYE